MKVLVTGGTGYVGAHIVAALLAQGHDVRMLVRRPDQVVKSLGPLRVAVGDLIMGDVLDEQAVARSLDGVDAVVHAAAVFSLDPRRAQEVLDTNERATELVVGGAVARGLDPVVHISSTVALTRYGGSDDDLPLGDVDLPYAASKRASEEQVRAYQADGAPVVSVYPGGVLGPHDPYLGTNAELLTWIAKGRLPSWPKGGAHYVDVRDVAAVVVAAMEPGQGPRRYVVPGHFVDAELLFGTLRELTGRRFPYVEMPRRVGRLSSKVLDKVNRRLPESLHLPGDPEGIELAIRATRFDTRRTTAELGVTARPFAETVGDTLLWLAETGRLEAKHLGRLAGRDGEVSTPLR